MGGKPGGTLWEKMNYAVGLEYGYSLPVTRRLNLDFVISVGYWGGEYHKYAPIGDCYVWKETQLRHWFAPTKAEISLVRQDMRFTPVTTQRNLFRKNWGKFICVRE